MKTVRILLTIVIVLISMLLIASSAETNDGLHSENFAIVWSVSNGGGGRMSSGNFGIQNSALESIAGTSHSQSFSIYSGALPGLELVANAATPVAPDVNITLIPANDGALAWVPDTANCSYKIHQAATPYFLINSSTVYTTLSAGVDNFIIYDLLGSPDNNNFFVVQGVNCTGLMAANSIEVGAFSFEIVTFQDISLQTPAQAIQLSSWPDKQWH